MLVLSRHVSERVILRLPDNREIVVSVEKIDHSGGRLRAKLGFVASKDVVIIRQELQEKKT